MAICSILFVDCLMVIPWRLCLCSNQSMILCFVFFDFFVHQVLPLLDGVLVLFHTMVVRTECRLKQNTFKISQFFAIEFMYSCTTYRIHFAFIVPCVYVGVLKCLIDRDAIVGVNDQHTAQ